MVKKEINKEEHIKIVELGEKVQSFVDSDMWSQVIKPILDSFVKGLIDARDIDVSSDKKAAVEIKARVEAAKYLEQVETFLRGFILDGQQSRAILEPPEDKHPLYRTKKKYE